MHQHLRIARPVSVLARSSRMYAEGLELEVIGRFDDHDGFDGVMLGREGDAYHFELTHCREHSVVPTPTVEDLIVLYVAEADEWQLACERMLSAGFVPVPSFNAYWDARGRTFTDPDGYRFVLQNAEWQNRVT